MSQLYVYTVVFIMIYLGMPGKTGSPEKTIPTSEGVAKQDELSYKGASLTRINL